MSLSLVRRLSGSRIARIFGAGVTAQAMLSAANLAVALLLIRFAGNEQYGYFVLVQVTITLLSTAQGAWINGPLSVLAPKREDDDRDRMIALVRHDQRRWVLVLGLIALVAIGAGSALQLWNHHIAGLLGAGAVSSILVLLRELSRQSLTISGRIKLLLICDGVYVVSLLGLIAAASFAPGERSIWAVLAVGCAAGLAVVVERRARHYATQRDVPASREIWRAMRPLGAWATVGAVIYWIQSQSFNYTLASLLSVEAVAHVNAIRLMLMPVVLLMVGVSGMLMPMAAGWLHREGLPHLMRRLVVVIGALLALDLVYLVVLWFLRHWVIRDVMKADIPEADLLIVMWAIHALLCTTHQILQAAALAMEMFKPLAWLSALSAVISLGAMWTSVPLLGSSGAIVGTAMGEGVFLVGITWMLLVRLRRHRAQFPPGEPLKVVE